jgi:hypothetical protein
VKLNQLLLDGAPEADRNPLELGLKSEGGNFVCRKRNLISLKGAPDEVDGNFDCGENELTSLEGGPTVVKGHYICSHNNLTSLKGAPKEVGGGFFARNNMLASLEGAPALVDGDFSVSDNKLTSLKDIHKQVKEIDGVFYCTGNPLESHVLGLMKIKGLTMVFLDNHEVEDILNELLPGGSVLEAQSALLDAGLDDWAQL